MNPNTTTTTRTPLPAYMASSVDPSAVSKRISGLVLTSSSIIILIATQVFHVGLTSNDVISWATELGAVGGAITTLYGTFIWLMTKFGKRTPDVVTPVVSVNPNTVVPPPGQNE